MRTGYRTFSGKAKKCIGCSRLYLVYNSRTIKKELHCNLENEEKIRKCLDGINDYHEPDSYIAAAHPDAYPCKWEKIK